MSPHTMPCEKFGRGPEIDKNIEKMKACFQNSNQNRKTVKAKQHVRDNRKKTQKETKKYENERKQNKGEQNLGRWSRFRKWC